MAVVDVTIDATQLELLAERGHKRLAYATVNAIRKTGLRVQQAEFSEARRKFIIRKPRFFFGTPARPGGVAAKIEVWPSVKQNRPYMEIAVGQRGGKSGPVLYAHFEAGGPRRPRTPGAKHIAVPRLGGPARPNIARGVPPRWTIKGLKFRAFFEGKKVRRRRRGKTTGVGIFERGGGRLRLPEGKGAVQYKGRERTFIIREVGIFRRIGPKRRDIESVYPFIPPFQLDDRLEFIPTARRVADRWFREEMEREVVDVLTFVRR